MKLEASILKVRQPFDHTSKEPTLSYPQVRPHPEILSFIVDVESVQIER